MQIFLQLPPYFLFTFSLSLFTLFIRLTFYIFYLLHFLPYSLYRQLPSYSPKCIYFLLSHPDHNPHHYSSREAAKVQLLSIVFGLINSRKEKFNNFLIRNLQNSEGIWKTRPELSRQCFQQGGIWIWQYWWGIYWIFDGISYCLLH